MGRWREEDCGAGGIEGGEDGQGSGGDVGEEDGRAMRGEGREAAACCRR